MSKRKRLLYKDLDTLRFLAFVPIFLFSVSYLLQSEENEILQDVTAALGYLRQNSMDFFFFLSAFLLTSHALREQKYKETFSLRYYFIRRGMRILPLFILGILFVFLIHPWILQTLKLTQVSVPSGRGYLLFFPNYFGTLTAEQFIYLGVIWSIYMFIQFSIFWGLVLKFFLNQIKYVAYVAMAIGIASRTYHVLLGTSFEFNTLAMGVPIGIGAITALIIRKEQRTVEFIKHSVKGNHVLIYIIGTLTVLAGYLFLGKTYAAAVIPIITSAFFGYMAIEQTYGKNSVYKFRTSKVMSRLGRISFGLIVYSSIVSTLAVISVVSLDLSLESIGMQALFVVFCFFMTWLLADISYNYFESPILAVKKGFKRS